MLLHYNEQRVNKGWNLELFSHFILACICTSLKGGILYRPPCFYDVLRASKKKFKPFTHVYTHKFAGTGLTLIRVRFILTVGLNEY